ncbi:MAG: hypothetical protein ACK53L_24590, partial [Pirellulaceae bacterium]
LQKSEDLNAEGKAIREQSYRLGQLAQRQYTNRDGVLMSRELFDSDGFLSETIIYDRRGLPSDLPQEIDHWWFERGMPVQQVKEGKTFRRQGDRWVGSASESPSAAQP